MRILIFFPKIFTILKLEVGFFSTKKNFFADFSKYDNFFYLNFISKKKNQKIREPFWIGRAGGRAVGRDITTLRAVVRGGASQLGAPGFGTERARLAGGTSLPSWFQKKCLLPMRISIFFFLKIPRIFKLDVGFFSAKKKFFADIPK